MNGGAVWLFLPALTQAPLVSAGVRSRKCGCAQRPGLSFSGPASCERYAQKGSEKSSEKLSEKSSENSS